MALLLTPTQWTRQPQVPVPLDMGRSWSSALTEVAYPANRNALRGVTSYAMAALPNPKGMGWRPTTTTSGGAVLTDITRTAERTYLMVGDFPASSATQQFFLDTNTGTRDIIVYTPGSNFQLFVEGSTTLSAASLFTPSGNTVIYRIKNGTQNLFSNGVLLGTGISASTASQKKLTLGSRFTSTLGLFEGAINFFASFSYFMPDGDVAALSANPWQIFAPLQRRIWTGVAAAPATFNAGWARQRSHVIGAGVR